MLKSSLGKEIFNWDCPKKGVIMDLGKYIKSSDAKPSSPYPVERRCMQCGNMLRNEGDPLYYQRFCCKTCKERYVGMPLTD